MSSGWLGKSIVSIVVVLVVAAAGGAMWLRGALSDRPDISAWQEQYTLPSSACPSRTRCLTARWMGVTTLAISDGETTLLSDGFFSRIPVVDVVLGLPYAPDEAAIEAGLERAGLDRVAGVMVVHSHYDHAMDAGIVALRTGAVLLGSRSTANVGRGAGLPEERIVEVEPGEPHAFGDFRVTFYLSKHVPLPMGPLGGEIEEPLVPPVAATDYREGGAYTIVVDHPLGSLLLQGSAGWVEGALARVEADTVLLGIGGLASQGEAYADRYYREIVEAVGAKRVIPVHWDDFLLPPGSVEPTPRLLDDVAGSFRAVEERSRGGAELALLPPWQAVVLFSEPR